MSHAAAAHQITAQESHTGEATRPGLIEKTTEIVGTLNQSLAVASTIYAKIAPPMPPTPLRDDTVPQADLREPSLNMNIAESLDLAMQLRQLVNKICEQL